MLQGDLDGAVDFAMDRFVFKKALGGNLHFNIRWGVVGYTTDLRGAALSAADAMLVRWNLETPGPIRAVLAGEPDLEEVSASATADGLSYSIPQCLWEASC